MGEIDMTPQLTCRKEAGMLDKGLRAALSPWSSRRSRVRTKFHPIMGRMPVVSKLIAFAVMIALVLSMTGCKLLDIG